MRRWSADFQLRAHLLNLRCLSFELRRENFHSLPQFLDFAMLFDLFLKPARGAGGPELTVGIYDDIYRIGNPRCVGLAIDTRVTNIDIVIARGKAAAGANARCRVVAAGGVVQERLITVGRVADPLSWFSESGFIGVYPWP